ncbi:hypothetical protein SGRI78S_04629 [Streptomyces griseus subsp. griseus]
MRRPGAQRATSSGEQASPPTIRQEKPGRSAAGTLARAAGGISAWVTRRPAITSASGSPARGPGSGTTRAAPEVSAMHSSSTEASKLGEENCRTRLSPVTAKRSRSVAAKAASPAWVTTTPLGTPVEPEV